MIKMQMPEDIRFRSTKKAVTLSESILKIQAKLKDTTLPPEKRKSYINQKISLLDQSSSELRKPVNPELLTEEEWKYLREPLASYYHELGREIQKQFSIEDARSKKPRKAKKKNTKLLL